MNNIEDKTTKLLKELDITKLKEESKRTNVLLQQLLQKLMLTYVVDISEKVLQKHEEVIDFYPSDLISSLKIIADLYLKMKEENKLLEIETSQGGFKDNRIF